MKKLLVITLMMLSGMTATAQGVWSTGMNEADELKGLLGGPYYRYDVEGIGSFILWDWEDWKFRIITDKGKFEEHISSGKWYTSINLGLYSSDGKLTDKLESIIEVDHSDPNTATIDKNWMAYYGPGKKSKIKKMIRSLKSGDGYVRIVCSRVGMQDFDLKITKYDIEEQYSEAYKD